MAFHFLCFSFSKMFGVPEMLSKQEEEFIEKQCIWDCALCHKKAELLCKQQGDLGHKDSPNSKPVLPALWF